MTSHTDAPRPIWISKQEIYDAPNAYALRALLQARWDAAPADPVEVAAPALIQGAIPWAQQGESGREFFRQSARQALRALGWPADA